MARRSGSFAALVAMVVAFTPPSALAAPTGIDFVAPAGWTPMDPALAPEPGIIAIWLSPAPPVNSFRESINILSRPNPASLTGYVQKGLALLKVAEPAMRVVSSEPNPHCPEGTSMTTEFEFGPTGSWRSLVQVATQNGATIYIATYSRDAGSDADPAAVKAIEAMCPALPVSVRPPIPG